MKWFYSDNRAQRSKWICERFINEIGSCRNLLDVGCSESAIKLYLPGHIDYKGIDISGNPDYKINLDAIAQLPFENNQFDIVICADVLEHLENVHLIFDELCRITNKFLIVTLPNPAYGAYRYILRIKYSGQTRESTSYGTYMKFYGLPIERPVDRHRWFYGYDEAIRFVEHRTIRNGLKIKSIENNLMFERIYGLKRIAANLLRFFNPNLAYRDIIFVISRSSC